MDKDQSSKASHSWSAKERIGILLFAVYNIALITSVLYAQLELASVKKSQQEQNDEQQRLQVNQMNLRRQLTTLERRCDNIKKAQQTVMQVPNDTDKLINLINEVFSSLNGGSFSLDRMKREVLSKDKLDLSSLLRGRDGRDGPPGPPGPQGIQGPPGPAGKDGRDATSLQLVNQLISTTVAQMVSTEMDKVKLQAKQIPTVVGATYVRWGRTVCSNESSLIYKGRAAGQFYDHYGGSSQFLCMPEDPEYNSTFSTGYGTTMYGVEYEYSGNFKSISGSSQNVPCVLCQANDRAIQAVFPAKVRCPDKTWTKEYSGIFMTAAAGHKGRTEILCIDGDPETVPGMRLEENGALLYSIAVACGGGSNTGNFGLCPPYKSAPITCTVCSK